MGGAWAGCLTGVRWARPRPSLPQQTPSLQPLEDPCSLHPLPGRVPWSQGPEAFKGLPSRMPPVCCGPWSQHHGPPPTPVPGLRLGMVRSQIPCVLLGLLEAPASQSAPSSCVSLLRIQTLSPKDPPPRLWNPQARPGPSTIPVWTRAQGLTGAAVLVSPAEPSTGGWGRRSWCVTAGAKARLTLSSGPGAWCLQPSPLLLGGREAEHHPPTWSRRSARLGSSPAHLHPGPGLREQCFLLFRLLPWGLCPEVAFPGPTPGLRFPSRLLKGKRMVRVLRLAVIVAEGELPLTAPVPGRSADTAILGQLSLC